MRTRRLLDLIFATGGLIVLGPVCGLIAILIKATSRGPVLYWSNRVGVNNQIFSMPKFRTMRTDTPVVATHLLVDPRRHLTPIGGFLRRFSLDELPQLLSMMKGDVTLIGPRPALYNQEDLIELRTKHGVHAQIPGLTGWAQVNGRDTLTVETKVGLERNYLENRTVLLDIKIVLLTVLKVLRGDGVIH